MKKTLKKYPLLISLIISCVIVISSVFVLAFCGLKLSPSLGGGSQLEIAIKDDMDSKKCVSDIKSILGKHGFTVDSCSVEEKTLATTEQGEFTKRYIVVNILSTNISDEKETEIISDLAEKLNLPESNISSIENIISSIKSKDILLFGLGIGIIAICLFVYGFIRYDVFAGLSFLVSILHNIILFLSVIILTRIPLSLVSLAAISILTLVLSAVLISIFEKNKVENELHTAEKETPSIKMIRAEINAVKPYIFVVGATLLFALLLFIVPVVNVIFSALSVIIALIVSSYTVILIGPGVYASLLDIRAINLQATLSRNDTVNKVIKKKIAKSNKTSK